MPTLMPLILVFILGYIGYRLLNFLQFPASRIVGPILLIAAVQMTGITFVIPKSFQIVFSVVFGVYLGLRFNREAISKLKRTLLPAGMISIVYVGLTLLYGTTLTTISGMEQNTAFLAVIPGGIAEAGVLAVSYQADLAQVSAFQLVRFLSIVLVVPSLSRLFFKPKLKAVSSKAAILIQTEPQSVTTPTKRPYPAFTLFLIGGCFSWLFTQVHFPAALLLGATFGVAITQLLIIKSFSQPPQSIYNIAQIGMGTVIGTSFTTQSLQAVGALAGPMALLTFLILGSSLLLGYIFSKYFKWDFMTGFMSVLPGGLSTMIILADDFDADVVIISSMQLVRLITAVMIIPILYQWLL